MRIVIKTTHYADLAPASAQAVEEKLAPVARLLGNDTDHALLEVELEHAPAEGRSSEPCRMVANLSMLGDVFHAEAVKPTPESAADRVRNELEKEIRRVRGKSEHLFKRGGRALKNMLRFGR